MEVVKKDTLLATLPKMCQPSPSYDDVEHDGINLAYTCFGNIGVKKVAHAVCNSLKTVNVENTTVYIWASKYLPLELGTEAMIVKETVHTAIYVIAVATGMVPVVATVTDNTSLGKYHEYYIYVMHAIGLQCFGGDKFLMLVTDNADTLHTSYLKGACQACKPDAVTTDGKTVYKKLLALQEATAVVPHQPEILNKEAWKLAVGLVVDLIVEHRSLTITRAQFLTDLHLNTLCKYAGGNTLGMTVLKRLANAGLFTIHRVQ